MHEAMSRAARTSSSSRIRTVRPIVLTVIGRAGRVGLWARRYERGSPCYGRRNAARRSGMARIDLFRMERMQSLYWHEVEYDLSESGVLPLTIEELLELGGVPEPASFLRTGLGYPLSEGSLESRERIAAWYPG